MPTSEMRVESDYLIPEETPVTVVLNAVTVKEFQSRDRDTKVLQFDAAGNPVMYPKWNWEFQVSEGPYAGVNLSKLTVPYISTASDNLVRQYAETLTGKTWGESEGINTDDLVGLRAIAVVKHQKPRPKKNGDGMWYGLDIADLYPADALEDSVPPF